MDEADRKISRQTFPIALNDPLSWNAIRGWILTNSKLRYLEIQTRPWDEIYRECLFDYSEALGKILGSTASPARLTKNSKWVSLGRWKLWRSWIVIRANGCPKTQILERSENKRHQFWATQDCPYMLLHQDETKRQILKRMLPIMCSTIYCREIEHLDEAERKVSRQLFPIVLKDPLSWNEASRWNRA